MPPRKKNKPKYNLRQYAPRPEFLADLGIERDLEQGDIVYLQIRFLEELCKTWRFTHQRYDIMKHKAANRMEQLKAVVDAEKPYIDNIKEIHNAIIFIRAILFQSTQHQMYQTQRKLLQQCYRQQIEEYKKCAESFDYFCDYWVWIHEPRFPEMGLPGKIPFVRFLKQRETTKDIHEAYTTRQNLLIEKAREQGISWLVCAYLAWQWLFNNDFTAIMASEKEEKVDIMGSTKALIGKIRYILYALPPWMLPDTWQKDMSTYILGGENDNFRKLINPDKRCEITGEAGVNIGRSGRASIVVIDESQSISTPDQLDQALESVTNCRIDIGTPLGMNHFGQRRFSDTVIVSTLHWYDDPRKTVKWQKGEFDHDSDWLKYKLATTKDKTVLAQEYFLDYNASVEDSVCPSEWVMAAVDFDVDPIGINQSGFDVADSGENKCMYARRTGPKVFPLKEVSFDSPAHAALESIRLAEKDMVDIYTYDRDGVGISVPTVLDLLDTQPAFHLNPVRNNSSALEIMIDEEGRKASEIWTNRRAQNWYGLRERLKKTYEHVKKIHYYPTEQLVSLPNDPDLISQLSQPKRKTKGKKLGVESKADMKSRGVKSPDKADAVVFAFAETEQKSQVVSKFNYTAHKEHYKRFVVDIYAAATDQYVSIYQTPDLATHVIGCIWNNRKAILQVYWCMSETSASVKDVVFSVKAHMSPDVNPIKEWIGNSEMFKNIKTAADCPYYHYKRNNVKLKENYASDPRGDIMTLNEMFESGMIQINNPDCETLMYQIYNWTRIHGKPTMEMGIVLALAQLVSRLKSKKRTRPPTREPVGYGMHGRYGVSTPEEVIKNLPK